MFKISSLFSLLAFTLLPFIGFSQDCSIDNIIVEAHDCVDGFFYVDIEVQASNVGAEGFRVQGNGHNYGNFSYEETFITIGPLEGDGTTPYEFVVIDNQFPNCSSFVEFGTIDCTPDNCELSNLVVDFQGCNQDGSYNFVFNFEHANTNNVGFDLFLNGQFHEFYAYDNLPASLNHIGPFESEYFHIQICENDNPDCCVVLEVMTPDCPVSDECIIENVYSPNPVICEDGVVYIDLTVVGANFGTQGFSVLSNGVDYGDYSYDENYVTVGPFQGNGPTAYELTVMDNEFPNCTHTLLTDTVFCDPVDCIIEQVGYEIGECNDDGGFYVYLAVSSSAHGAEGFSVVGNGNDYGDFSYEEPYITLGPFEGNGNSVYEFVVLDNQFPNCGNEVVIEAPDCFPDECAFQIWAEEINCNSFALFSSLDQDIEWFLNGPNGEYLGSNHAIDFVAEAPGTYEICGQYESPECPQGYTACTSFVVSEDCFSNECGFENLTFHFEGCQQNGSYYYVLDFDPVNTTNEFFDLYIQNEFFGYFAYSELPILLEGIGPFESQGFLVQVCDNDNPNCCNHIEVTTPDCQPNECGFENISFNFEGCNDNGSYNYALNFDPVNTLYEEFNLYIFDEYFGTFAYADLPVFIEGIGPMNTNAFEVTICETDNPFCCSEFDVLTPDCNNTDCSINEVIVEAHDCNDDGSFYVDIEVHATNHGNEGFSVVGNGNDYGDFSYEETFITLGPFEGNGTSIYEFVIIDNQFDNCTNYGFIEAPDCFGNGCEFEVWYEEINCHSFVLFPSIDQNMEWFVNEEYFGSGESFDFVASEAGTYVICGLYETPNCPQGYSSCVTIEISEDCFSNECGFENLSVFYEGCNNEGEYYYVLDFDPVNTTNQFFDLYIQNEFFGYYAYDQLPLLLEGVGPFESEAFVIQVCDNDNPNCCAAIEVETPDCNNGNCELDGLTFNFEGCNDDGSYNFAINFDPVNTTSEYFDLYIYDNLIGSYAYADLPFLVEGIGPFNNQGFVVIVSDHINSSCYTAMEVATPECNTDDCVINEIIVEAHDCNDDGSFYVDIEVHATNHGNEGFSILGNGNDYGDFSYNEPYITLGPFEGNGTSVYEFVVIDNQFEDCGNEVILQAPDCFPDDCTFEGVTFNFEGCNEDGSYNYALNFDPINNTNQYFDFYINDEFYGYFAYEQLTVLIENIGPFDNEYFQITICDNDNPNCCITIDIETPECNNNEECNIWDVVVEPHLADCDNNVFSVDVAFESTNTGFLGYYIFANGDIFGPFSYELPFVTVGPFEGDGQTQYDFLILDVANPSCYAYHEFGTFECDEDVWPGDTNSDNISNNFDLLNIGIAYGSQGTPREDDNTEWDAMPASNWNNFFEDNTNYKHADSNGDGIVDEDDIAAIYQNYNFTHGEVSAFNPLPGTEIDPPVYMDVPDNLNSGSTFEIPVMLGTEGEPVNDIYGIAFSVDFDPELVDVSDLSVSFPTSWMGEPAVNIITFSRINTATNSIDIAISRKDQNEVSGFGPIVYLHGIIDDIAGIHGEMELKATKINAIDYSQNPIPLNNPYKTSIISKTRETDLAWLNLLRNTWISPNPASDVLNVMNKHYVEVESISILNMAGVQVGETYYNTNEVSISNLPAGMYGVRINLGGHTIMKKLVKVER